MEKNQLRTGNIIQTESAIYKVENISGGHWGLDCIDIKTRREMCVSVNKAQPVPLTEEWLLRLGFDKKENNEYSTDIDNGWSIIYQSCGFIYLKYLELECEVSHFEYKYVHQLQNLIFALTGKELYYEGL